MDEEKVEEKDNQNWVDFKIKGNKKAREKLAEKYIPLVKYIVERIAAKLPNFIDKEDLINEGIIGLLGAIDKFDFERGVKFETYACVRIRGSILDSLRSKDLLPRTLRQKEKEVEKAYGEIEKKLGRAATDEEISNFLGINLEEFYSTISQIESSVVFSFEDMFTKMEEDKPIPLVEKIRNKSSEDPVIEILENDLKNNLVEAVKRLPEQERIVIALYYYENLNLKEIGKILNITESRASQLHTQAVIRLKGCLKDFIYD